MEGRPASLVEQRAGEAVPNEFVFAVRPRDARRIARAVTPYFSVDELWARVEPVDDGVFANPDLDIGWLSRKYSEVSRGDTPRAVWLGSDIGFTR